MLSTLVAVLNWVLDKLIGVFLGAKSRKRRLQAHLRNIRAEIKESINCALDYEISPYKAPAYRCPTDVYDRTFTERLVEEFDGDQVAEVRAFYASVGEFNRCLQHVHDAVSSHDKRDQVNRALIKARHVMEKSHDALAIVESKLSS